MLDDLQRRGVRPRTLGADKGYDDGAYLARLERRGIDPHVDIRAGAIRLDTDEGVTRWLCRAMSRYKEHKRSQ